MNDYTPLADKAHAEISALRKFRKRYPLLFWPLVIVVIAAASYGAYDYIVIRKRIDAENTALRGENQKLRENLDDKNSEVNRLETQLTPFRTLALIKYPGDELLALKNLASDVERLEKDLANERKTIRSFSASVSLAISGTDLSEKQRRKATLIDFDRQAAYVTFSGSSTNNPIAIPLNPTGV